MDGWVDGWMDGWVGGWVDGWMDGWMESCANANKIRTRLSLVLGSRSLLEAGEAPELRIHTRCRV